MSKLNKGFALVSAIFLLVIMSAGAVIITNLAATQGKQLEFAVHGAKAYYAAVGGLEWAAHTALNTSSCPAPTTINYTQAGLNGYSVDITCAATTYAEHGSNFEVFTIDATGRFGSFGNADYASRALTLLITNAPA